MALDAARLRVLVEVAHAGSIAAAAVGMGFTASALSQQLAKLERETGCALVERRPDGIRLTAPGQTLVEHGERVLGELRDAETAIRAAAGDHSGDIVVGAFATAGRLLIPEALAKFRRERPGVRLSLVDIEPPRGYGEVTSRDLDLLVTHQYPGVTAPSAAGLRRTRLLADPIRLVLPPGHPTAGLADLADADWISGRHDSPNRICLGHLATEAGITPRVAYETVDYEVTLALVTAGLGVSLVPATVLAGRTGLTVRELRKPRPERLIHLVHRTRPPSAVAELATVLHDTATRISTLVHGPRAASTL